MGRENSHSYLGGSNMGVFSSLGYGYGKLVRDRTTGDQAHSMKPDFTAYTVDADGIISSTGKPLHNSQPHEQVDRTKTTDAAPKLKEAIAHQAHLNREGTTHSNVDHVPHVDSSGVQSKSYFTQTYGQATGDSKGFYSQGSGRSGMGAASAA